MSMTVGDLLKELTEIAEKHGTDKYIFTDIGGAQGLLSASYDEEEREDMNEEGDALGDIIAPEGVWLDFNID